VRAARTATPGYLIVAGSVNSAARIRSLADAGADAFTVGSAAFDGSFAPRKGLLGAHWRPSSRRADEAGVRPSGRRHGRRRAEGCLGP
jgi:hypothetical protein